MLPQQTARPAEAAHFARRLTYLSVIWIAATLAAGILLVILAPWMQGMF